MKKRLLAMIMAVVMAMSLLPVSVFAAQTPSAETELETYTVPDNAEVLEIIPVESTNVHTSATYLWNHNENMYMAVQIQQSKIENAVIKVDGQEGKRDAVATKALAIPQLDKTIEVTKPDKWVVFEWENTNIPVNETIQIEGNLQAGGHDLKGEFRVVVPSPAIQIEKTITKVNASDYTEESAVHPGDQIEYSVTVTNTGNTG